MEAKDVVELLRAELTRQRMQAEQDAARLRADLAAALESERRLWKAFATLRGAFGRCYGAADTVRESLAKGFEVDGGGFGATLDVVFEQSQDAGTIAGIAVE